MTDARSKSPADPFARHCNNNNPTVGQSAVILCPSPALSAGSEEVINVAKLAVICILILFSESALQVPSPELSLRKFTACVVFTLFISLSHIVCHHDSQQNKPGRGYKTT